MIFLEKALSLLSDLYVVLVSNSCFTNPTTCGRSPPPSPATPSTQSTASCKDSRTTSTPSSFPFTRCSTWHSTSLSTSGPSLSTTVTIASPTVWRVSSTAQLTTPTTTSSSTTITASTSLCGTAWEAPTDTRRLWWARVPWIRSRSFKRRESLKVIEWRLMGRWMDALREKSCVRRSNRGGDYDWFLKVRTIFVKTICYIQKTHQSTIQVPELYLPNNASCLFGTGMISLEAWTGVTRVDLHSLNFNKWFIVANSDCIWKTGQTNTCFKGNLWYCRTFWLVCFAHALVTQL